jgi:hypothetical protein
VSKRSIAATAAVLLAWTVVGIGPALATSETLTFDVHTHFTEPAGTVDGADCWGVSTITPGCRVHYVGLARFTGTIWGDEYSDASNTEEGLTPDGKLHYEGPDYITGGVEGCGTGTFILDTYEGNVDFSRFDPLTNTAPGANKWRLRRGSGTGELVNLVSGEGDTAWTVYLGGNGGDSQRFGEGDFTGTITCRSS